MAKDAAACTPEAYAIMSAMLTTFEALVKSNRIWVETRKGKHPLVKMYHIEARTHQQAREKAKKYGEPIRVQKADPLVMFGDIEHLPLQNDIYIPGGQYSEMTYSPLNYSNKVYEKRNKRRNNMHRDKE